MGKIVFLPGATGNIDFWQPLMNLLVSNIETQVIRYPGFADQAEAQHIKNFNDLTEYVAQQIQSPSILIAQSMGGIFAIHKTLSHPELIKGLILIASSGGIDLSAFNAQDWRSEYQTQYRNYPQWFVQTKVNYAARLHEINTPVLLLWGNQDPISPIGVGHYLHQQLKNSSLRIIDGAAHDLAHSHAEAASRYIQEFLAHIGQF